MDTKPRQVAFTEGHPILNVDNLAASLDYYCDTLGFEDVFHWSREDAPSWTFAHVRRGNFFVYLSQQAQGGSGMWMYLTVTTPDDLVELYHEYEAHAAKIIEPPTDKPWAMREMLIADLDGHILRIGSPRPRD